MAKESKKKCATIQRTVTEEVTVTLAWSDILRLIEIAHEHNEPGFEDLPIPSNWRDALVSIYADANYEKACITESNPVTVTYSCVLREKKD